MRNLASPLPQTEMYLLKADVPVTVLRTLLQLNLGASGVSTNSTAPQNFIHFCGLLILRMEIGELTAWKQPYVLNVCLPPSESAWLLHVTPRIHYFSLSFPLARLQDL